MARHVSERTLVFLVGAVQFVNILDFMMVMPLGPDFAVGLGVPLSRLGEVGGSYTASAGVAGLLGLFFLDRFDRRKALGVAMMGLVIGTVAGGFAWNFESMLAARLLAGAFGGPATALALAIIADAVPAERRGKALGAVMGAFAASSVIGVPFALKLGEWGTWRTPFFVVAAMGALVAGLGVFMLPPMTGHLQREGPPERLAETLSQLFARSVVLQSYAMTFVVMMAGFIVIPNISAFVQGNMAFPRDQVWLVYIVGGLVSLSVSRPVGALVDKWGSFRIGLVGSVGVVVVLVPVFVLEWTWLHPIFVFAVFMGAMAFRNVSYNTLATKVPRPQERARFMSVQSAVQHFASAAGAILSARLLVELPPKAAGLPPQLGGMPKVALISIALSALIPVMLFSVERKLRPQSLPVSAGKLPVDVETGVAPPGPSVLPPTTRKG